MGWWSILVKAEYLLLLSTVSSFFDCCFQDGAESPSGFLQVSVEVSSDLLCDVREPELGLPLDIVPLNLRPTPRTTDLDFLRGSPLGEVIEGRSSVTEAVGRELVVVVP